MHNYAYTAHFLNGACKALDLFQAKISELAAFEKDPAETHKAVDAQKQELLTLTRQLSYFARVGEGC